MTTLNSSDASENTYLARIESLVEQIIRHAGFELKFTVRKCAGTDDDSGTQQIVIDFDGTDSDLLLEKNGALLDAIEYVVLKAARIDDEHYAAISFDCRDWRRVRMEELRLTAQMAARQAIETGSPFYLTPMTPRERRIIHLALKDEATVRTMSEGSGPARKVVIYPATDPS